MEFQTTRLSKLHLTHCTFVGPFARVYSIVFSEVTRIAELFATFIALVWLLSRVNSRMNVQMFTTIKLLSAHRTLVTSTPTYLSQNNSSWLRFRWIGRRRVVGLFRIFLSHVSALPFGTCSNKNRGIIFFDLKLWSISKF